MANVNDAPTGTVAITGAAQEDQILTADTSAITDLDGLGAFGYAWQRSFDAGTTWTSTGVTAVSFTLHDPDVGVLVRVVVSYVDGHGTLETLTAATGPVAGVNDVPTLVANTGLTLAQGSSGGIGASQLRVADVDDTAAQLLFRLTSTPSSGALQLNGTVLAVNGTFTQADVDAGGSR